MYFTPSKSGLFPFIPEPQTSKWYHKHSGVHPPNVVKPLRIHPHGYTKRFVSQVIPDPSVDNEDQPLQASRMDRAAGDKLIQREKASIRMGFQALSTGRSQMVSLSPT